MFRCPFAPANGGVNPQCSKLRVCRADRLGCVLVLLSSRGVKERRSPSPRMPRVTRRPRRERRPAATPRPCELGTGWRRCGADEGRSLGYVPPDRRRLSAHSKLRTEKPWRLPGDPVFIPCRELSRRRHAGREKRDALTLRRPWRCRSEGDGQVLVASQYLRRLSLVL